MRIALELLYFLLLLGAFCVFCIPMQPHLLPRLQIHLFIFIFCCSHLGVGLCPNPCSSLQWHVWPERRIAKRIRWRICSVWEIWQRFLAKSKQSEWMVKMKIEFCFLFKFVWTCLMYHTGSHSDKQLVVYCYACRNMLNFTL